MARKRYSDEDRIGILRQVEVALAGGTIMFPRGVYDRPHFPPPQLQPLISQAQCLNTTL